MSATIEKIEDRFNSHPTKPGQQDKYKQLMGNAKAFAVAIELLCPDSREKSLAMTNLEQAAMWANAAIARNE